MLTNSRIVAVLALVLGSVNASQAITIFVAGGGIPFQLTGQLQIIVDIAPENFRFNDGGLSLAVTSSCPGMIEFTQAEILEPPGLGGGFIDRWSLRLVNGLGPDGIEDLFAASLNTPALNPLIPGNADGGSASSFIFATIDYQLAPYFLRQRDFPVFLRTDIHVGISSRPDPLVDQGVDVSAQVQFVGTSIRTLGGIPIPCLPEPSALLLTAMAVIGVVATGHSRG